MGTAERRALDRVMVPGAIVSYKKMKTVALFDRFSQPKPLRNISKSGVCFELDQPIKYGERIRLEIKIPGHKTLRLDGNVRWFKSAMDNGKFFAGAQFVPFGKGKDFNSMGVLEDLRNLYKKYCS